MTDLVERLHGPAPHMIGPLMDEAADEIELLRELRATDLELREADRAEIERLRAALQALHDWYVEYARINNLFNDDGSPATFHELLEARRILGGKR